MMITAPTLTEMWHKTCDRLLYARRADLDFASSAYTIDYDNVLFTPSMEYDYDIGKDAWLTRQRWHKLQRDYLVPHEVDPFIERCVQCAIGKAAKRGTITQMFFKQNERNTETISHVWGNCLMALTYRGGPKTTKPVITIHSRTVFIAFLGGMDLALTHVLAEMIADATGQDVADFGLRWYADAIGWHCFKSIPYIMAHGHYDNVMDEKQFHAKDFPSMGASRGWIKRLEALEVDEFKFGQAKRMAQRWKLERDGPGFPSIPLSEMHLLPIMTERNHRAS